MDKQDKLETKIDLITDRLNSIDVTLAKQSVILEEHVKRTNLLEDKIAPVEKHVLVLHAVFKMIGALAMMGGGVHSILHWLLKVY